MIDNEQTQDRAPQRRWPGLFISIEGGDGVGKSTQIRRLEERFVQAGYSVLLTREPGGSAGAEDIRKLLVTGGTDRWSALTEALLMNAARADHLAKTITPALAKGKVVISDRFADSTMAYQGIAGNLPISTIETLQSIVVGDQMPDLTIILGLNADQGLKRTKTRQVRISDSESRFEDKGAAYQQKVADAFLVIAQKNPQRCVLINANNSIEDVAEAIWQAVRQRFALKDLLDE